MKRLFRNLFGPPARQSAPGARPVSLALDRLEDRCVPTATPVHIEASVVILDTAGAPAQLHIRDSERSGRTTRYSRVDELKSDTSVVQMWDRLHAPSVSSARDLAKQVAGDAIATNDILQGYGRLLDAFAVQPGLLNLSVQQGPYNAFLPLLQGVETGLKNTVTAVAHDTALPPAKAQQAEDTLKRLADQIAEGVLDMQAVAAAQAAAGSNAQAVVPSLVAEDAALATLVAQAVGTPTRPATPPSPLPNLSEIEIGMLQAVVDRYLSSYAGDAGYAQLKTNASNLLAAERRMALAAEA